MNKVRSIVTSLCLSALALSLLIDVFAYPPITQPDTLLSAVAQGWAPVTVDPAWCNEQASKQLIFNVYEPLIFYNGEHVDMYMPQIATSWTLQNITGTTNPEGLPWYFRYTFAVRQNVKFHDNSTVLTPQDVEYSIERAMVQDRDGGPTWMLYQPLLNSYRASDLGDLSDPHDVAAIGKMIDSAVESNITHVWFNLAFPGAYAPFMQVLCHICSSILSRQWINDYVVATLGRIDWSGNWTYGGDHTEWITYHAPIASPLDLPYPVMMGTGPYKLATLDYPSQYWSIERNVDYWRGWPADWPALAGTRPAGYVDRFNLTWAYDWNARSVMFLNGEVDFCDVPRANIAELYKSSTPPYAPPNYPLDGIRCIFPLPSLAVDAMFFTFDVDPATPYGTIYDYGVIGENGIPRDFFGNATYGIYMRKAFSNCIDFDTFINTAYLGEAMQPPTAFIPSLPYYDASIPKYTMNLTKATEYFQMWPGIWNTGFALTLVCDMGDLARRAACEMIESNVESLNLLFHITVVDVDSRQYEAAMVKHQLPAFVGGWQADFPDAHSMAYTFYHTLGTLAAAQLYSNPTMDALIDAGIMTPDGPARAAIYSDIQQLVIDDCPSVALDYAIGRHFERDWVTDWYCNMLYPATSTYQGIYAYPLWKQYYPPHSQYNSTPPQPTSNNLPADVNYDGVINFLDLSYPVAHAFGAVYGPPMSSNWVFRFDFNNDRKIDVKDMGFIPKYLGTGTPNPLHGGVIGLVAQPSKQNVSINYNVNITVAINSATNFSGYEIRILFDPIILTLTTYEVIPVPGWTSTSSAAYSKVIGSQNCTAVSFWLEKDTSFTGNTTLVIFTFKGLAKGQTTLDISTSTLATGWPMQTTSYNYTNCNVTVTMTGDINGDGRIDMRDISYVARRFMCYPGDPLWDSNADINNDGKIDMIDIGITARHFMETDP